MNNEEEYDHHHEIEVEFPAELGDLVEVDAYDTQVFQVEGYRVESYFYPDRQYSEIVYELRDAINGAYIEADADDLLLLADAGQADEYMRTIDCENYPQNFMLDIANLLGGGIDMKSQEPRKPTARELSGIEAERRKQARKEKKAQIDRLLDERNDYAELLARFNDEEYGDKIMAVDAVLKKLAEVGE